MVIYCLEPIFTVNRDLSEEGKGRIVVKEATPPQAAWPQPHEHNPILKQEDALRLA
jgi:hypothetical protein